MTENEKMNAQKVDLPMTLYLMLFLQLLMTGYVAFLLRAGIVIMVSL